MSAEREQMLTGITRIAIVANTVYGIDAYRAQCLTCPWTCHRQAHEAIETAQCCASRHVCKNVTSISSDAGDPTQTEEQDCPHG